MGYDNTFGSFTGNSFLSLIITSFLVALCPIMLVCGQSPYLRQSNYAMVLGFREIYFSGKYFSDGNDQVITTFNTGVGSLLS